MNIVRRIAMAVALVLAGLHVAPARADDIAAASRSVVRVVTIAIVDQEVVGFGHGSGFAVGGSEGCQFKAGDRVRIEASDMGTITTIKGLNEQSSGSKIAGKGEDR